MPTEAARHLHVGAQIVFFAEDAHGDRGRIDRRLHCNGQIESAEILLVDGAGNSHRAELNVEKLWNPLLAGRGRLRKALAIALVERVTLSGSNLATLNFSLALNLPDNSFCFDTPVYKDPARLTVYHRPTVGAGQRRRNRSTSETTAGAMPRRRPSRC